MAKKPLKKKPNRTLKNFKRDLFANKLVRTAYDEQAPEYVSAMIEARDATGMTAQFSPGKV